MKFIMGSKDEEAPEDHQHLKTERLLSDACVVRRMTTLLHHLDEALSSSPFLPFGAVYWSNPHAALYLP